MKDKHNDDFTIGFSEWLSDNGWERYPLISSWWCKEIGFLRFSAKTTAELLGIYRQVIEEKEKCK